MLDSTSQLEAPGQPDDYLEIGRKLARDAHGRNNYSIGIYSALTQDKSHQTAFHAAMALARSGKRLLLVDADPAAELTRFVSLDGYPGFLDALSLNRISDDFIHCPIRAISSSCRRDRHETGHRIDVRIGGKPSRFSCKHTHRLA